jgi:hypothetical protein
VFLDGKLLGRLGGFDPYRIQMRAQPFDLQPMSAGVHELRVEMTDPGDAAPLLVDLRATGASGDAARCVSGADWRVRRDDGPETPVKLHARQDGDGAAWHLFRRPHPLPGSAWLEGEQPADCVLDLPLMPPIADPVDQSFEWTIPPGATSLQMKLVDAIEPVLTVDGGAVAIDADGRATLPAGDASGARSATLRVRSRQLGGGVLGSAVSYTFGPGLLKTGSWTNQGLRSYSGAIRMRQRFELNSNARKADLLLDVGQVRGAAEVRLNGHPLGARFLAPYRFHLGDAARAGANGLELLVTNTLANFLSTWSPTRGWSPDQFECGVFGPVRILSNER